MKLKSLFQTLTQQTKINPFKQDIEYTQSANINMKEQQKYNQNQQQQQHQPQQLQQYDSDQKLNNFINDLISKKYKKIGVLTGAGISVSAGIPDFRSRESGLYSKIQKQYNIQDPMKIFSIRYYRENPIPFMRVIQDYFSREYQPTYAHKLIHLLNQRNQLLVNITQNIDGLEYKIGLPSNKIVQAHGHLRSASCINCNHTVDISLYIENCQKLDINIHKCPKCNHIFKPNVVFFGEVLPSDFYKNQDILQEADCVIVMGTSLAVFPFASLVTNISSSLPIYIINNQLPKNINNLDNTITFLQGDINNISQNIHHHLQKSSSSSY